MFSSVIMPTKWPSRTTGTVEHMLRQVTPGRYDAYEALLRALATPGSGQV